MYLPRILSLKVNKIKGKTLKMFCFLLVSVKLRVAYCEKKIWILIIALENRKGFVLFSCCVPSLPLICPLFLSILSFNNYLFNSYMPDMYCSVFSSANTVGEHNRGDFLLPWSSQLMGLSVKQYSQYSHIKC